MIIAGQSGSNRKNLSKAKKLDFICKREDTFNVSFDVYYVDAQGLEQAYDFTGCLLKMHVKKKATDKVPVLYMNIAVSGNTITLTQNPEQMSINAGNYVYDIELYDRDGENITILYGNFRVLQDVTEFITVLQANYKISFANDIVYQYQPVFTATVNFQQQILYFRQLWEQQTSGITLSNSLIYEIVQWLRISQTVLLGSSYFYTYDPRVGYSATFYNNIIYYIEEFR